MQLLEAFSSQVYGTYEERITPTLPYEGVICTFMLWTYYTLRCTHALELWERRARNVNLCAPRGIIS